jgi:type I restriction enzyme R subunit
MSGKDWKTRCWKQVFARIDQWLDHTPASRHLADDELAEVIVSTLRHFADERYELLAYVVMPSHFHWIFRPLPQWSETLDPSRTPREYIMQSVKGYTARRCNQLRGWQGTFWQEESYDHWVRDEAELERIVQYVEHNPVTAGLAAKPEDWPHSSASARGKL